MSQLGLYTHSMSCGRITCWMREEVGAEYRLEPLKYGGSMTGADNLAINPMARCRRFVTAML